MLCYMYINKKKLNISVGLIETNPEVKFQIHRTVFFDLDSFFFNNLLNLKVAETVVLETSSRGKDSLVELFLFGNSICIR